ncbi:MAG: PIN domain-containing protein [Candidatus Aenigmarchaeota archaeon]|nr:PIN domain-containing protein [Candidatus Aenigmarchaeota archaeon]
MACLETTFLIDLLKGKKEIETIKNELDKTESVLAIASPSLMELWSGANFGSIPSREKEKIEMLISSLTVLSLNEKSAKEAGDIEADLIKKGLTIETEDIMVAGIARANGEKVVTRDAHYSRIPGLKVLKY